MSYILDALKRADAERERGKIPGLRAQPIPATSSRPARSTAGLQRWVLFAAALLVAMLAAMVWQMRGPGTRSDKPGDRPGDRPVAVAPAPVASAIPATAPPPPTPTAPPPAAPAIVAPPAPAAVVRAPTPAPAPPAVTAKAAAPAVPAVRAVPVAPATPPSADVAKGEASTARRAVSAPAAAAPVESRIPAFAELPEDTKRQIPALAISGSIYSENPAQRMVTIGSQVFQEGDKPAADLVLEQIGRKAAIFNFRGTRYSLAY